MKHQSYITSRSLLLVSSVIVLACLAAIIPALLSLLALGLVFTAFLLWKDFQSLPKKTAWHLSIELPEFGHLGEELRGQLFLSKSEGTHEYHAASQCHVILPVSRYIQWHNSLTRFSASEEGSYSLEICGLPQCLGSDLLEAITIVAPSAMGLWQRHLAFPVNRKVRVLPPRTVIPENVFTQLSRHSPRISQNRRVLRRGVNEDQFHSTRPYRYPDSIRRIDSRKSAKFRSLMTREYDSHHSSNLVLALDASRIMRGRIAGSYKFDYAVCAALNLARAAIMQGDRFSALVFHEQLEWAAKSSSTLRALAPLQEGKSHLRPRDCGAQYQNLPSYVHSLEAKRSIVVVFTDTTQPGIAQMLLPQLERLARTHLVLILSLLDDQYDLQAFLESDQQIRDEQDMGDLLYRYWLREQQSLFERQVARKGMSSLVIPEQYFLSATNKAYSALRSSLGN